MWNKIREKSGLYAYIIYFIFGIGFLLYIPIKCGQDIYHRIQNPPSKIYANNQTFDQWESFCISGESENGCELNGYRLKTKSKIGHLKNVPLPMISIIEVDENFNELSIILRDWETGEIIQPYPQTKKKWYQFNKEYDSFETIGTLLDEDGNDIIDYEVTLMQDKILITKASCDSKGFEENRYKVKGGCFFLEYYEKNKKEWHSLDIILKDKRKALIHL